MEALIGPRDGDVILRRAGVAAYGMGLAFLLTLLLAATTVLASADPKPGDEEKTRQRLGKSGAGHSTILARSNSQNRLRPQRVVRSTATGDEATYREPATRPVMSAERPIDWWPFGIQPPFGRLVREEKLRSRAIMVGNAMFTADTGPPVIPQELTDLRPVEDGNGYYVAHFTYTLSQGDVTRLESLGVRVIRYVPRNAYLLKIGSNFELPAGFQGLDGIFRYHPAFKISDRIGATPLSLSTLERRGVDRFRLRLIVFPGEDPAIVAGRVADLGVDVVYTSAPAPLEPGELADGRARARHTAYVEVRLPIEIAGEAIPAIARLESVRWIEEIEDYRPSSDWTVSGWNYGDSRSAGSDFLTIRQPWNNGLHGEGILIGNVDTGVDFDHTYLADPVQPAVSQENPPTMACPGGGPKNSSKVPYYHLGSPTDSLTPVCYDQTSESANPSLFGHGTATSGLFGADPTGSDNTNIDQSSGTAPEVQIWMYDVGPASGGSLALNPAELSAELEKMAQAGASAVNLAFVNGSADG